MRPTASTAAALERAGVALLRNEPLARHTRLQVGGTVELFLVPGSADELSSAIQILGDADRPYRVLGAGSNLIPADDGLDFAVVTTRGLARPCVLDGTRVVADAGIWLPRLARIVGRCGLSGFEFALGIPGSVGGALRMNAGTSDHDMSEVVAAVTAVRLADGTVTEGALHPSFRYRSADFDSGAVVTSVALELRTDDPAAVHARMTRSLAARRLSQPVSSSSAGCIFRNPAGRSAGQLIDQAGLKGLCIGAAQVSELHGNFLVNQGGARAADFFALIELLVDTVHDFFGFELELEVVAWHPGS